MKDYSSWYLGDTEKVLKGIPLLGEQQEEEAQREIDLLQDLGKIIIKKGDNPDLKTIQTWSSFSTTLASWVGETTCCTKLSSSNTVKEET